MIGVWLLIPRMDKEGMLAVSFNSSRHAGKMFSPL